MYLYKAVAGVVTHKRLAINSITGVELASVHPELEELVAQGILTRKTNDEVKAPVLITKPADTLPPANLPKVE